MRQKVPVAKSLLRRRSDFKVTGNETQERGRKGKRKRGSGGVGRREEREEGREKREVKQEQKSMFARIVAIYSDGREG